MAIVSKININRFKNTCFVGLNKVELHTESGDMLQADNWLDITDEQTRKSMMLGYFAPRDLSGEPMPPEDVLMGEDDDETAVSYLRQLKSISMFDLCRARKAEPNTVHILITADVVFHWDMTDNFITPTTNEEWVEDVKQILNNYPRQTTKHLYTAWDTSLAQQELDGVKFYSLDDLPLDSGMWVNMPSLQEKYGNHSLFTGLLIAGGIYFGLNAQNAEIENLRQDVRRAQQSGVYADSVRRTLNDINEIEEFIQYSGLNSLILKDLGSAIKYSQYKIDSYILENPTPSSPTNVLVATINSIEDAYVEGFSQQEEAAANLLRNSSTITAIRKPALTNTTRLILEALIPLPEVAQEVAEYQQASNRSRANTEGSE